MKKLVFMLLSIMLATMCTAMAFCADGTSISKVNWTVSKGAQVVVHCDDVTPEESIAVDLYNSRDELVSSAAVKFDEMMRNGNIYTDYSYDVYDIVDFSKSIDNKDAYYFVAKGLGDEVKSDVFYYGNIHTLYGSFGVSYSDCFDNMIYVGLQGGAGTAYYWNLEKNDFVEEESVAYAGNAYGMTGGTGIDLHQLKPIKEGDVTFKAQLCTYMANSPVYAEAFITYHIDSNLKVTFVDYTLKEYDRSWIHGDADGDGGITAADAAIVIQKVLAYDFKTPIEDKTDDYMKVLDVDGSGDLTSNDGAYIMQKALNNSYVLPIEG